MRQRLALRVFRIAQQRRRSGVSDLEILRVEAGKACHAQLLAQLAVAERGVELPGRAVGDGDARLHQCGWLRVAVDQRFARVQARQPAREFGRGAFGQAQLTAGQAQPRQTPGEHTTLRALRQREQQRVALVGEQFGVGDGAGRDHAHHLSLHRALGSGHVAHLFGDRHRLAHADELGEVVLHRMHRHARHHHRLAGALAAGGERDVEQAIGAARVVEEQLVEIAHAIEHERVGMLGLDTQVLRHHRRVVGERVARLGRGGRGGCVHRGRRRVRTRARLASVRGRGVRTCARRRCRECARPSSQAARLRVLPPRCLPWRPGPARV